MALQTPGWVPEDAGGNAELSAVYGGVGYKPSFSRVAYIWGRHLCVSRVALGARVGAE